MNITRRLLLPLLVGLPALLGLLVPGALGAPRVAGSSPSPAPASIVPTRLLSATLSTCHSDPLAANRYAIFASQMTSIADANTMAVNFQLQERSAKGAPFAAVSAPGFGVWVSSQPGVGIYTSDHEVTALPAPAAFRVLVRARWLDRRHHVIRRAVHLSPVCVQPLLAPNLAIGALTRAPGSQAATVSYTVLVRNAGTAAAGPFQVSFSVGGVALPNVTVAGLAAGATQLVTFAGPHCVAGSSLTAVADQAGAVSEPANPNRSKTFPCVR
jgi:CARDB